MKLPAGVTEQEATDAINQCVNVLAPKFVFGSHEVSDLKQLGWVFALEMLASEKYDRSRGPLVNFMYRHLRNRYANLYRDACRRPISDIACKVCRDYLLDVGEGHPDGLCKKTRAWMVRNSAKRSLCELESLPEVLGAVPGSSPNDAANPLLGVVNDPSARVEEGELAHLIDERLPIELRSDYLKLRDGVLVERHRRRKVQEAVAEILEGAGLEVPDD